MMKSYVVQISTGWNDFALHPEVYRLTCYVIHIHSSVIQIFVETRVQRIVGQNTSALFLSKRNDSCQNNQKHANTFWMRYTLSWAHVPSIRTVRLRALLQRDNANICSESQHDFLDCASRLCPTQVLNWETFHCIAHCRKIILPVHLALTPLSRICRPCM